jgi:hypothetical protein
LERNLNHKRRADVGDLGKAAADNHCLSGGGKPS